MMKFFAAGIAALAFFGSAIMDRAADTPDIVFPPDAGIVDVTKAPYHAKGDGVQDDTEAINRALRDHNAANSPDSFMSWTVYLPKGTYLVSGTLEPKDPKDPQKNQCGVRIIGQGVGQTIIKLKNGAPGFDRPDSPRYVIRTGNKPEAGGQPNSGFSNYIQHLTVDVGARNAGAIGIRFDVANCGAMEHVRLLSSDPQKQGRAGLGFFGTCGPGYVKDVEIDGFDYGVFLDDTTVNNLAFEHIRLQDQRVSGIYNRAKNIQIRGLTSRNRVPAVQVVQPVAATFLVEANLTGQGAGPAIALESPSFLYARDVRVSGYDLAIDTAPGAPKGDVRTNLVSEWLSHDTGSSKAQSLRLPIKDTPEYHSADLSTWANVTAFGATRDPGSAPKRRVGAQPHSPTDDDAPGIQKAMDSGKEVIYFPRGVYTLKSEVVVRGKVKKIDFLFSRIDAEGAGRIRVADVAGEAVVLENLATGAPILHDSPDAVAIRHRGRGGKILTGPNARGDLFVENAGPHVAIEVRGISVWLRQINRERPGFLNDGATVWYFADNIERMQENHVGADTKINPIRTINGGKTELIGGALDAIHVPHTPKDGALIECINSTVSAIYAGELRKTKDGAGWGSWPLHIRAVQGDKRVLVTENDVLYLNKGGAKAQRYVVPLFVTRDGAEKK